MSENGLQPLHPEKRMGPIVETGGRNVAGPGASGRTGKPGRVRRSGSGRQARIAVFVILVVGALLAAGYFLFIPGDESLVVSDYATATVSVSTLQESVELSGVVTARSETTVTAPEAGSMGTLLVDEGDWVSEGDLIAVLETEELEDSLETVELELERQEREYERFLLQHEYDLRAFDRTRENLLDALNDAEVELAEMTELFALGSASQSEVDEWQDLVHDAQDAIDDREAEVEETIAVHELNRSNYEDDLESLQQDIEDLEERIADARITSPMTGRVITIADAATTSGERIAQYQTLMEIADARNPLIETEIEEQYVDVISVGQPVSVEISDSTVVGSIERIGLTASSSSDGGTPVVELDVAVDIGESEITIGTSTIVVVLVAEVADAVVLPRGPYLTSGNRTYLYRINDGGDEAERIPVTYGAVTDESVEILSGVEPGDRIITSSYSSYIDYKTIQLGEDR